MAKDRIVSTRLTRRSFGKGCGVGLAAILSSPAFATEAPVVRTNAGRVRGSCENGVSIFRGIPYGAPTSGANRFAAPQPVEPWNGVREATSFGLRSPQQAGGGSGEDFSSWREPLAEGEDCLVLNVWAPDTDKGAKRPVMVWLHGGGLAVSSGATPVTDGAHLARRQDVVVVSVNHRLNLFGYLYFGGLTKDRSVAANPGQLDLVAALRWVHDNIAEFGGDPGNVTIFGHSGGGLKVAGLLAMPEANGLFHRAILQSGFGTVTVSPDEGERITARLCEFLGVRSGDVAALRALPVQRLLEALQHVTGGNPTLGPGLVPDGQVIARAPFGAGLPTVSPHIPIMLGHTSEETTVLFPPPGAFDLDWASLPAALAGRVREAGPLIEGFRRIRPDASPSDIFFAITTEAGMGRNARIVGESRIAGGAAPAFVYLVRWQSPAQGGKLRSPHGMEVPMVFDNVTEAFPMIGERMANAQMLADTLSTYWANFARTGNPNGDCLPQWPAYEDPRRATMIIDTRLSVEDDPLRAEQALIESHA